MFPPGKAAQSVHFGQDLCAIPSDCLHTYNHRSASLNSKQNEILSPTHVPTPLSQPLHPALQATLPSCPHGGLEPPKCHIQVLRGSHISLLLLSEPVLLGLPRS